MVSFHVTGNLRIGDLERAIRLVTNRHEASRTCFAEDHDNAAEGHHMVLPKSSLRLERKRMVAVEEVAEEYAALQSQVFDLANGDVTRPVLLTLSSSSHYIMVNYDHIIMDGASGNIFLLDLEKTYNGISLGPQPLQYLDFSTAQREALANGVMLEKPN